MMMRRIAWNCFAWRGLVKKSAMLSAVRTKGTSSSSDSTMSRTKNVLHAVVVLRVVGDVASALAVGLELGRPRLCLAETIDELAQVHDVLGGLGEGDDLGLARGQRHALLLA